MTPDPSVSVPQPNPSGGPVPVEDIYRCFDRGHDVGLRHEGGSLYSGTCHDCGTRYERRPVVPSARVDLDLDQIEARANAATARPWDHKGWHRSPHGESYAVWRGKPEGSYPIAQTERGLQGWHDAEFIAHAREDVPRLVAEVRRLRERNSWLEQRFIDQAHTLHAERWNELLDSLEGMRAERDAARAEAEELRRGYRTVCDYAEQHDTTRAELNEAVAEAVRVREALQAVRDLHVVGRCGCDPNSPHSTGHCRVCGIKAGWPCATVRALGVES